MIRNVGDAPDLDGFREYLSQFGLGDGTIALYAHDVTTALGAGGVVTRLKDDELAPLTRRHILAAGRHWANYTDDGKLTAALLRLRLPAPMRKSAKVPLSRAEMFMVIDQIDAASFLSPAMRALLGMMAKRGFRAGDVLRLRRREVGNAMKTGTLAFEAKGRRRLEFRVIDTWKRYLELLAAQPRWQRVDEIIAPESADQHRRRSALVAVERMIRKVGASVGIDGLYPHQLRRTYAVEYLRALAGDPEGLVKLTQHMQWASMTTAMQYVDHARGEELDDVAERIFQR